MYYSPSIAILGHVILFTRSPYTLNRYVASRDPISPCTLYSRPPTALPADRPLTGGQLSRPLHLAQPLRPPPSPNP